MSFQPASPTHFAAATLLRPLNVPAAALPSAAVPDGGVGSPGSLGSPCSADRDSEAAPIFELGLRLMGRGSGADLCLSPPALLLRGGTTIGAQVTYTISLSNPNGAARRWRWESEDDLGLGEVPHPLIVSLEPSEGEVAAGETLTIEVSLRGAALGLLSRSLRIYVSPHGNPLSLPLQLLVDGPEVFMRTQKLDFGLVPFGEIRDLKLVFQNLSERPARWKLLPGPVPPSSIATAAASVQFAALGNASPPPLPSGGYSWEWSTAGGESKGATDARLAANALALALAAQHTATGLRPSTCCGIIEPKSTADVIVRVDAAAEQSLRRHLELKVEHGRSAYVIATAEVVARRATVSPSSVPLGNTYVRVPTLRTLTLTNLSLVPTEFAWNHVVGTGEAAVTISPEMGILDPAQTLSVEVTVAAESAGALDILIGCIVHGGSAPPVGCRLTASVQGLTVEYEAIGPDAPLLAQLAATVAADEQDLSPRQVALPLPKIDFGSIPIFEQRSMVLLIRNRSAVRANYRLSPARYPAVQETPSVDFQADRVSYLPMVSTHAPVPEDFNQSASYLAALKTANLKTRKEAEAVARQARLSGAPGALPADSDVLGGGGGLATGAGPNVGNGSSEGIVSARTSSRRGSSGVALAFSRPILSDAHERSQLFFSENGVTYCAQQELRRREAALLAAGLGGCFEVAPSVGTLEPWSQVAIIVSVHSCMWGMYITARVRCFPLNCLQAPRECVFQSLQV